MESELQITMQQALGETRYAEYVEAAQTHLCAVEGLNLESAGDLKASIGWILKAQQVERESNRVLFQERRAMEDGDTGRVEWIEQDLRRCLSIFRFARAERLTVRQAVDWLAQHAEDEKLPSEFIEAFGEANKK